MASFGKHVFFFIFLVIFSSIQARESKFFSKFMHYSIAKNNGKKESTISWVPIQAPTLAPAPAPALLVDLPELAPAPAPVLGESGHGRFGESSEMFPPKKTSTTITSTNTADESELLNEELDGVTFDKKYENGNYNNNGYTSNYNSNGYASNYNNNGYGTSSYNNKNNGHKLGGARYETGNQNNNGYTNNYYNNGYKLAGESYETGKQNSENGYSNNYNINGYKLAGESYETGNQNSENGYTNNYNNNGHTTNYGNNGYETERQGMSDTRFMEGGKYYHNVKNTERQGMSDTRFMEGGKYYYNVKNENYYPANEYESGKVSTQNQGSYGNDENSNEFNTMEEYESKEGYEESQEEQSLP